MDLEQRFLVTSPDPDSFGVPEIWSADDCSKKHCKSLSYDLPKEAIAKTGTGPVTIFQLFSQNERGGRHALETPAIR